MISDEEKDQVRAASDLVAIVQETVELKPRGHEFWGCCPFHGEKTPSFHIIPATQVWHCFGCGAGGSVIDFVIRLFGLSFAQACLKLNCDFGLGLTGERPSMAERSALLEARRREAQEKEAAAALYREKAAEYRQLWEAQKFLSPDIVGYIHPLYAEAAKKLPVLEWWLDQNIGR